MRKIIFLDIDGVLATPECMDESDTWALVDSKQELLKTILDSTGAEIVLSSSWRFNTLEQTKEHMAEKGFWFTEKITGITIRAYQWLERGTGIHLSIPRGVEIKQWLDTNIHSDNGKNWDRKKLGEDYNYVIIDDEADMLLEHKDHFVRTRSTKGLNIINVQRAIQILNNLKS